MPPKKILDKCIVLFYNERMGDLEYFSELWHAKKSGFAEHTPELWDSRAEEWIVDLRVDKNERAVAVTDYLLKRGVLNSDSSVADFGCGPGLFVAEFSKHCKRAVGVDFSSKFIEFARDKFKHIPNVEFIQSDFSDYPASEKFDIVFASNSPAVSNPQGITKFESHSKGWCCNMTFVKAEGRTGIGFYSLMNILYLRGYYPETYYFKINGSVYGSILWNINDRDENRKIEK